MRRKHNRRGLVALAAATATAVGCLALYGANVVSASQLHKAWDSVFGSSKVGQTVNGRILLPSRQWISPIGERIQVNNGRLLSSTLSPDGTKLAALSWNEFNGFLTIIDVKTGKIVQQVGTGTKTDPSLGDGSVGPDGPLYSPDGKTLWFPQSADLMRFTVNPADGTVSSPVTIKLIGTNGPALPAGMALSSDGSKLYVALNGSNTLGVIDTKSNTLVSQVPVGNAPRQVVLDGTTAFVSNEGGRTAVSGDVTNLSYGTPIVSNPSTGAAVSGTVSVVDLTGKAATASINVGLEPTAMYRDGSTLFVANSNNDSVSIINMASQKVTQTFHVNPVPHERVGSYPNAITMSDATHLLVSIGRDDAIAVYRYKDETTPVVFKGLLPTDWYPVQVQPDAALGGQIVVTCDKGIGARGIKSTLDQGPGTTPATDYNTYDDTGTVTHFALPADQQLKHYTDIVFADNAWNTTGTAAAKNADSVIPRHPGERSPIKHVFVIIRENRTYDQVLGDVPDGNGDAADAQFGMKVTPNQHALAERFGLFDNFYDVGTLSADGHNWIVQAEANDYVEKEFGAFYRSYPAQGGDALAYQRVGFLWNAAQKASRSVSDFGEYANFFDVPATGAPTWTDWYKDSQILEGKANGPLPVPIHQYRTYSDIPSLNGIINPWYPKFDLDVPDQYRVDIWEHAFRKSEKPGGHLANLNLLWLPDDHTSGAAAGYPYPTAQVADNDLALGRIVQDISHSRFWKSTAIFVMEDDTQNGVDHVDGHRGPFWVISPYSKPYAVNDTYYNQVDAVRTVEQILGIKPMNQEDGTAQAMYSAFTNRPDFRSYNARPNAVPLTLGVPGFSAKASSAFRQATSIPVSEQAIEKQWVKWSAAQDFIGPNPVEDDANPAQLNRVTWYSSTGWLRPYPGDTKILAPNQVPGRDLPAQDLGDG